MLPLDAQLLRDIAPRFSGAMFADQRRITDALGPLLTAKLAKYEIDSALRIAHFLGQCCEESAGYRALEEFASGEAYEGRRDLGNTHTGDGKRYKGRGIIEITGLFNYTAIGKILGLDLVNHPELAADPSNALTIACEFWKDKNINRWADRDNSVQVTEAINGGQNGLTDRINYTNKAKTALARIQGFIIHGAQGNDPATDLPVIHRGASGPAVVALQTGLSNLGFKVPITGQFDPGTEKVVEAFQNSKQLDDDGIVGHDTWTALNAAMAALPPGTGLPS